LGLAKGRLVRGRRPDRIVGSFLQPKRLVKNR
jgi:hypothetical protein